MLSVTILFRIQMSAECVHLFVKFYIGRFEFWVTADSREQFQDDFGDALRADVWDQLREHVGLFEDEGEELNRK